MKFEIIPMLIVKFSPCAEAKVIVSAQCLKHIFHLISSHFTFTDEKSSLKPTKKFSMTLFYNNSTLFLSSRFKLPSTCLNCFERDASPEAPPFELKFTGHQ